MRKLILTTLLLIGCVLLCDCAQHSNNNNPCTPEAAYLAGVNDAQNGRNMQENYAVFCPAAADHKRLNNAYSRGYNQYIGRRRAPLPHRLPPYQHDPRVSR
jgi:hypothetical protein